MRVDFAHDFAEIRLIALGYTRKARYLLKNDDVPLLAFECFGDIDVRLVFLPAVSLDCVIFIGARSGAQTVPAVIKRASTFDHSCEEDFIVGVELGEELRHIEGGIVGETVADCQNPQGIFRGGRVERLFNYRRVERFRHRLRFVRPA